jgi:hypothetical protein
LKLTRLIALAIPASLLCALSSAESQFADPFFGDLSPIVATDICGEAEFIDRAGIDAQMCKEITKIAGMRCLAIVSPISLSEVVSGKTNEDELRETYEMLFRFCMQSMTLMILDTKEHAEH